MVSPELFIQPGKLGGEFVEQLDLPLEVLLCVAVVHVLEHLLQLCVPA